VLALLLGYGAYVVVFEVVNVVLSVAGT
jgi:hypothetical protein